MLPFLQLNKKQTPIFFASLLLLAGFITLSTYFFCRGEIRFRTEQLKQVETHLINIDAHIIIQTLRELKADLCSISGHHLLTQFLSSGRQEDLKGLHQDLLSFTVAKKRYAQIRLLDRDGREKLRINREGEAFKVLPPEALQEKGHRYYTSEALTLDPGQIYLSRFDLNIEHGRIQQPFEPMLRLVTPLADLEGEKAGLLVLNYDGKDLFSKLIPSGNQGRGKLMLLNGNGHWLKGPWPEYEWGFMFSDKKEKTFSRLFPRVWDAMTGPDESGLLIDQGIFIYHHIYPEKIIGITPSPRKKRWTIVSWVSPEEIDALTAPLKKKYSMLWLILSLLSLISAWFISFFIVRHRQTREEIQTLARFPHENPSPIIRVDTRGTIAYANPASAELLRCWGVSQGMALPAQLTEIEQNHGQSSLGAGVEIAAGEKRFWFLPAPLSASGELYLYGRDITDLKAAKEELETHYRRQEAISAILALALREMTLEQFLAEALDTLLELPCTHPRQRGAIFLTRNHGDVLELAAYSGYPEGSSGPCPQITMGKCLCGKAAQCREIILAKDTDPTHHLRNKNEPPHSHFCIPVLSRNRVLGVLNLHTEKEHTADSQEINFLNALAEALALIIEQKRSFEALRKSEASLRKAQRISHLGNWDYDVQTDKIYWSDEIFRIFGVDPDKFTATFEAFINMVHPDDRSLVEETVDKASNQGRPFNIEHRIIRPGGDLRIVRETGEVIPGPNGTPQRMTGIVQDITVQEETKQERILVSKVFNNAIEGISVTDETGAIEYVNKAFTRITGYTGEEVIGQNPRILKSDRQPPQFYETMWKSLTENGHWKGEIWNRRKSGEAFPEWLSITAIEDSWQTKRKYIALFHDRSDLRRAEKEIEYKSSYDALTGLFNRDIFKDRLDAALSQMRGDRQKLAIFAIDLDDFKTVNNSLGHKAGDELLQNVAARLKESFGSQTDIGRLGGDEFLILIQNLKNEEDTARALEKIFQEVSSRPYDIQGKEIFITPSVGIALAPDDGSNADTLIQNADLAVDRSKKRGPNRYSYFSKAVGQEAQKRIDLLNTMRRALDQNTFRVFYQPQTDAKTGQIKGMEALVRWPKDEPRFVSPAVFIPLAEKSGLIRPLGDFVLREACRQTGRWREMGFEDLKVAVNLSVHQVLEPGLPQKVAQILKETALPPENLVLEVTESALMNDMDAAETVLRELNSMGIGIHLDDFGTGYSSLSYLRRLPVNCLKIDKSFVDDTPLDTEANTMITAIISMAHSLNHTVVAEGVETREQLVFLRSQGCDVIQGYFFSPPLPVSEFESYLRQS